MRGAAGVEVAVVVLARGLSISSSPPTYVFMTSMRTTCRVINQYAWRKVFIAATHHCCMPPQLPRLGSTSVSVADIGGMERRFPIPEHRVRHPFHLVA